MPVLHILETKIKIFADENFMLIDVLIDTN